MSKQVDERVVSMQFDNRNFETNVKTTMLTLDKLKEKLHFKGAEKGIDNVNNSVKKFNVSPMSNAIETVKVKFSALEVMGVTALANITNSAVNAGKRIVSALTIEPVKTGFNEYELKMGSVQTIMASTGESLATVNKYLDELNEYSDKTIYSFSDMTTNIGKFTNAGVKLEDAVLAIKGVSNEAAVSGANANEASRAMYNFAQALSAGYVKLIDWKSIENANMATVEFKNQLLESAVACGTLTKTADGMYSTGKRNINATHEFNESLTDQWMTTEVLVNTLKNYADENTDIGKKAYAAAQDVKTFSMMLDTLKESAQSGWAQTWEIVFGDFEQAKKLWTGLTNRFDKIIQKTSDWRNNLLKGALGDSSSKWDEFIAKINKAGISTEAFESKLKETAKNNGIAIDDLIKEYGSLYNVIKAGKIDKGIIIETLKKFVDNATKVKNVTSEVTGKLEDFQNIVNKVINGDFGNGVERIEGLTKAGYNHLTVQKLVNKVWEKNGGTWKNTTITAEDLTDALNDMSTEEIQSIGYTKEQAEAIKELAEEAEKSGTPINELLDSLSRPSGRELLIDTFRNAFNGLAKAFNAFKSAWRETFNPFTSNNLYNIIAAIHKFSEKLVMSDETADKLKRTLKGVFSLIKIITTITSGALKIALTIIGKLLGLVDVDLLSVTAKIGDIIVKIQKWITDHDFITKAISATVGAIVKLISKIGELVNKLLQLPAIKSTISKVKNYFSEGIEKVKEFIGRVKEIDKLDFSTFKRILVDFRDNVLKHFINFDAIGGWFSDMFGALKKGLATAKKYISDNVKSIADFFVLIKDKIVNLFKYLDSKFGVGDILSILFGVSFLKSIKVIAKGLETFNSIIETINNSITKVANSIAGFIKSRTLLSKSQAVRNFALSIGILAASLYVLSKIEHDKLWSSVGALVALTAALTIFSLAIGLMGKLTVSDAAAKNMLGVAVSLLILISCLKKLQKLDPDKTWNSLGILMAMLAGLTTAAIILGIASPKLAKGSLALIGLAISLKILISVLKSLSKLNLSNIDDALSVMMKLMIGLAVVMAASKGVKMGAALSIIGIALALKMIISSLKKVADMDPQSLSNSMSAILKLLAMISLIMVASHFAGRNAAKAGVAMIGVGLSLLLITGAMKVLSTMSESDMNKALKVVSKMLLIFSAIIAVSYLAGQHAQKAGLMLLSMAGALFAITIVLAILKNMKPDGMDRALKVIGFISLIFAALIASTKNVPAKCVGTLLVLASIVVILTGIMYLLSKLDANQINNASKCLTSIIASLSLLVLAVGTIDKNKTSFVSSLSTMSVLMLVLGGLALLLAGMSKLDISVSEETILGISALLIALSTACVILGKAGEVSKSAMGAVLVLSGVIAILAVILGTLAALELNLSINNAIALSILVNALSTACVILSKAYTVSPMALAAAGVLTLVVGALGLIVGGINKLGFNIPIETATSLSILLLALSSACIVLSAVGATGPAAIIGAAILAAVVVELGALLIAIGALMTYVPKAEEFLDKGIDILIKLGNGIGRFIGAFVGGILEGLTDSLVKIADKLSDFMIHLNPFIENAKKVDKQSMDGVTAIADIIWTLSKAALLQALTNLLGVFTGRSSITKFSKELVKFGEGIAEFSDIISGHINPEDVESASNAGKMLAEMSKTLPKTGGIKSWFTGNTMSMQTFGAQLKPFGEAMVSFSDIVAGKIDSNAVESASNAGKMLAELANTLPREGGFKAAFSGDQMSMEEFGNQLKPFGEAMVDFSDIVAGKISSEDVETAANAGKMLSEMAKTLPRDGGFKAVFSGDQMSIEEFGNKLIPFGEAMVNFSDIVGGNISPEDVETAANAGLMLAELANSLPKTGGIGSWFAGSKEDLVEFGIKLIPFGESMRKFSDSLTAEGGIDTDKIKVAVQAAKDIADMSKSGTIDASYFSGDMETFSNNLASFGKGIKRFSDEVNGIENSTAIDSAIKAGKGIAEMASSVPTTGGLFNAFTGETNLNTFSDQLTTFGKAITAFSLEIDSMDPNVVTNAATSGKAIAEMIKAIPESGGLKKLFGKDNNIDTFKSQLIGFGSAMKSFSESVVDISPDTVTNAATAGEALAKMVDSVPDNGGFKQLFGAYDDLSVFKTQLVTFGSAMKGFSDSITGINPDTVTNAATAGEALTKMVNSVPKENIFDKMFGSDESMINFKTKLVTFGSAMKGFSDSITGINPDTVTNAATAGEALMTMVKAIPKTGGLGELFSGKNDFSAFSTTITDFGKAIKNFYNIMGEGGIDASIATNAADAGKAIADMVKTIPIDEQGSVANFTSRMVTVGRAIKDFYRYFEDGGIDTSIVSNAADAGKHIINMVKNVPVEDEGSVANFTSKIVTVGSAIRSFYNYFKDGGIDTSIISNAVDAGKQIINMIKQIPSEISVNSQYIDNIPSFGEAIAQFAKKVSDIDVSELTSKSSSIKKSIDDLKNIGKDMSKNLSDGFDSGKTNLTNRIKNIIDDAVRSITNKSDLFLKAGKTLMSRLGSGIDDRKSSVKDKLSDTLDSMIKSINDKKTNFSDAGKNLVSGFADGIDEQTWEAEAKAAAMASAALEAAKEALDENSPSKEMYKVGAFAGMGLINSLIDYTSKVYDTGYDMGDMAKTGISKAISKVTSLIEGGIDSQPTIRPVLDLSDVTSGVGTIGSLLDINPSIGVISKLRSINSMMNGRIQNGDNSEVISAIKDLKNTIGSYSGNTYNINGITYDDGSNISNAVETIIRAARIERRM